MTHDTDDSTDADRSTEEPEHEPRVMHVRSDRNRDAIEERLAAIDQGDPEAVESLDPYVATVVHDPDDLHRITRPTNLELLRTIATHEPDSIRETARLVDRDVSQVHANLTELEEAGLVRFERDGQSKRPVVWYDEISLEIELRDESTGEPVDSAEPA